MKSKDNYVRQQKEIRLVDKLRGLKGKKLDAATRDLSPEQVKMLVNRAQRLRGKR